MRYTPGFKEWRRKYTADLFPLYIALKKMSDSQLEIVKNELLCGMAYEMLNPEESADSFKYAYSLLLTVMDYQRFERIGVVDGEH